MGDSDHRRRNIRSYLSIKDGAQPMNQTEVSRTSYDAPVCRNLIAEILTLTESECKSLLERLEIIREHKKKEATIDVTDSTTVDIIGPPDWSTLKTRRMWVSIIITEMGFAVFAIAEQVKQAAAADVVPGRTRTVQATPLGYTMGAKSGYCPINKITALIKE